ncbi:MAG: hypothetical protein JWO14_1092, partial [Solirubrobacterales bacterium]|nr:hypothetical protein [Solirubrobacterales bacterium]
MGRLWGKMEFLMPVSVFKRLTHRLAQALGTLFGGLFGIGATTSTIVPDDGGAGTAAEPTASGANGDGPGGAEPTPSESTTVEEKAHFDPPPRIRILDVQPSVDGGRFDVKRTLGEPVVASAEVFRDGHDQVRAVLRTRPPGGEWEETPMTWVDREVDGDRWVGTFTPDVEGVWTFEVGAFTERFATWHDEVSRKRNAPGEEDLSSEVAEGA